MRAFVDRYLGRGQGLPVINDLGACWSRPESWLSFAKMLGRRPIRDAKYLGLRFLSLREGLIGLFHLHVKFMAGLLVRPRLVAVVVLEFRHFHPVPLALGHDQVLVLAGCRVNDLLYRRV